MLESVHLLKRAICKMTLPVVSTFPSPFSDSVATFCKSNNTVLEFSLQTLNQVCVPACLHTCISLFSVRTTFLGGCFMQTKLIKTVCFVVSDILSGCQILTDLMLTKPEEMVTVAGAVMLAFDQLQNQTSLWENLLTIPQLFSSGSEEQVLAGVEALLTNIQR